MTNMISSLKRNAFLFTSAALLGMVVGCFDRHREKRLREELMAFRTGLFEYTNLEIRPDLMKSETETD